MLQHIFERGFIRAECSKSKSNQGGTAARVNMTCALDSDFVRPTLKTASRSHDRPRASQGFSSVASRTKEQSSLK
jgi:hypothetical protein